MIFITGPSGLLYWLVIPVAACVGSFIATVAWRLPRRISIISPRSSCVSCATSIRTFDLIPVVSWLFLRGRCRRCSNRIELAYPVIELMAVAVAVWSTAAFDGWRALASCILGWTLLTLTAIDIQHRILPDRLTLPLVALGLIVAWWTNPTTVHEHVIGGIVGFAAFAAVAYIYRIVSGREGLGLGDAKLLAAAGTWLGWASLPSVVLAASVSALAVTIVLTRLRNEQVNRTTAIAFGPYLAVGFWLVSVAGPLDFSIWDGIN